MKSSGIRIFYYLLCGILCMALLSQTNLIPWVSAEEQSNDTLQVSELEQEDQRTQDDKPGQGENREQEEKNTVSAADITDEDSESYEETDLLKEDDLNNIDINEDSIPYDGTSSDSDSNVSGDDLLSEKNLETDSGEDLSDAVLSEDSSGFSDTHGHWAEKIIRFWTDRKIVSGYPDGTFHPDEAISRSEAASLMAKVRKLTGETHPFFSDVPVDHWAFDRIQACYTFEIMKGKGNGFFSPASRITRQEAMTMLYRASTLTPAADEEGILKQIHDRKKVSSWAREAVAALLQEGIITPYSNGKLYPDDLITRCDFLSILYQLENKEKWDPSIHRTFALKDIRCIVTTVNDTEGVNPSFSVTRCGTGDPIFVLPHFTDLHHISLDYTLFDPDHISVMISGNKKAALDDPFDLTEVSSPDEDGAYPLTVSLSDGQYQKDYHYRLYYETSLDAMFLTSQEGSGGRPYVDKEKGNSVNGSLQMVSRNGKVLYDGLLKQVKSRGNSTFDYPKKPYQIKLQDKADLLDNGEKVKTWVLLSNYADASQMNDKLCKDLADEFGLPGTPDCQWIDLYFDGEYRGIYLLTEKVQVASTGLDITDLEGMYEESNSDYGQNPVIGVSKNRYGSRIQYVKNVSDPADISNGYLIEINNQEIDENAGFYTRRGWGLNVKSPENAGRRAVKYISEYFQRFEDAVYAVNRRGVYTGINPSTARSYTDYCDLDSLARMYLLYQFSFNADAYIQSTYFYMEDGILHQGPMWDSDQSFGITWTKVYSPNSRLRFNYLCEALEKISSFRRAVKRIYDAEFRSLEETYTQQTVIDYKKELAGSERMNHFIWPEYFVLSGLGETWPQDTSYDSIVSNMQQWMNNRIQYLDRKFRTWN